MLTMKRMIALVIRTAREITKIKQPHIRGEYLVRPVGWHDRGDELPRTRGCG